MSFLRFISVICVTVFLAACQSANLSDNLNDEGTARNVAPQSSLYGEGDTKLLFISPASGGSQQRLKDAADGARLALDNLGDEKLQIQFLKLGSSNSQSDLAALVEASKSARLIIGLPTDKQVQTIRSAGNTNVPVLTLNSRRTGSGQYIWPMYSDEIDSVLQSLSALKSRQKIVLFHPEKTASSKIVKLEAGMRQLGGSITGKVPYPLKKTSALKIFQKSSTVIEEAEIAVVLGGNDGALNILEQLATSSVGTGISSAIVSSEIDEAAYSVSSMQGAMLAKPPTNGLTHIAERFQNTFQRPANYNAAIGFDTVAIAAGIVRTEGATALNATTLTKPKGFRATTGLFRFNANGTVERKMTVSRISGGKPVTIFEAGNGF